MLLLIFTREIHALMDCYFFVDSWTVFIIIEILHSTSHQKAY